MRKSIGPILIGILAVTLLMVSLFFRFMPQIAERWMRSEFNKTIYAKEIQWVFPFGVRIKGVSILDGEDDRSELIFQAQEVLAFWDWYTLLDKSKNNPTRLHVMNPQIVIRRRGNGYTHFLSNNDELGSSDSEVPRMHRVADKWFPDKLLISNGKIKYEDFSVGESGYSTVFSKVWLRYQKLNLSNKESKAFALEYECYWDQIRDEIPGEVFVSILNQNDSESDLQVKVRYDRIDLKSLQPYFKKHLTSSLVEGIASGTMSGDGTWNRLGIHSDITFNRLSFLNDQTLDNEIFGLDPVILREILRNKEGLVQIYPSFELDLSKNIESNIQVFFKALSHSMRSNFMMNLDKVVMDAMNELHPSKDIVMGNWDHMIAEKDKGFIARAIDKIEEYFKP